MPRKQPTLVAISSLIGVSIADLWATLHFNPTLSREANPLVSKLGFSTFGFITSNVALVALLCLALIAYFKGPRQLSSISTQDPWGYAGMALYGKPMLKSEFYRAMFLAWPLPASWYQLVRIMGFITVWGVIATRLAATVSWVAICQWRWASYLRFRELTVFFGYPFLEVILGLIVAVVMLRYFVITEFKIEQHNHAPQHS